MALSRILFSLGLSSLLLTGCGAFVTRGDLRGDSGSTVETTPVRGGGGTTVIKAQPVDSSNRMADVESDLREAIGRIEVLENQLGKSSQSQNQFLEGSRKDAQETEKKVDVLKEEVIRLETQVQALQAEIESMKSSSSSDDRGKKEIAKRDDYNEADQFFEQKEWRKAILNYQKYRDKNPKGKNFADATHKIGVSFQELGMKDEARTFYEEVISKFPNSATAKRSQTRLKSLK